MTLQDCYRQFDGDYIQTKSRLQSDRLIDKFILKFLDENTMPLLTEAITNHDQESAFLKAHTLKGIAQNLGMTALHLASHELCEALRNQWTDNVPELYQSVAEQYNIVIAAVKQYQSEKE